MGKGNFAHYAFNRGIVNPYVLARVDVDRLRLSAETQNNYLPMVLGPMMLRPGSEYITGVNGNYVCRYVPFIFSSSDTALLEFTNQTMRVLVNETPVTRVAVTGQVVSGDFSSATGWSVSTTGGGIGSITAGSLQISNPVLGGFVIAEQQVTIPSGDYGKEHAFRIIVTKGPITFRAGSTSGAENFIAETTLGTGTHSIAFTPNTNVYVQFSSRDTPVRIVDSILIEAAGVVTLPTPWVEADLPLVRTEQSGDVVFVACLGYRQRRIERRSTNSWSVVLYEVNDGPFLVNRTSNLSLSVVYSTGNTQLNADRAFFKSGHVGALFKLSTSGYAFNYEMAGEDTYTPAVRVTGVGADRTIAITRGGTWAGTLTLQRSFDGEDVGFVDVSGSTYTTNGTATLADGLSNSIVWYRIGFKVGAFTSGQAQVAIVYSGGGDTGICRVTTVNSNIQCEVEVLKRFTSSTKTKNWLESDWSGVRGYPTSVALHEGRLWWGGQDKLWGSISDAYGSFDQDFEGDAGPIIRSIGYGPIEITNSLLPLTRLIVLNEGSEISVRSSSFDEPLTPTNFSFKDCSTQGSARINALKIDKRGLFVDKSKKRLYELAYSVESQDYNAVDLSQLYAGPDSKLVSGIALQRQPDTRVYCWHSDGTVSCLIYEKDQEVMAWWTISTQGVIEQVLTLPGEEEDKVYLVVRRVINGSTVRYLERFSKITENKGLPEARLMDAYKKLYSATATTSFSGLSHLAGMSVAAWGWNDTDTAGRDLGTLTVTSGGAVTLPEAVQNVVIGLPYTARFKSSKLAYAAQAGTALLQKKNLNYLGLNMMNTHYQGVRFGVDFDNMDNLPLVEDGATTPENTIWTEYDKVSFPSPGRWDTDSRLCLESASPRPATIKAAIISLQANEKL